MITGQKIWIYLAVVLFTLAVIAPVLRQIVDYSSIEVQLVEEVPDKDTDNNDKEEKQDSKICTMENSLGSSVAVMASSHQAELIHSTDYSSMPDPPPEFI